MCIALLPGRYHSVIGGFVVESYLGWRWTQWITLIMAALFGIIGLFVIPETSAARILQLRAKELCYETKIWALHAKADKNRITFHTIRTIYFIRPFVMLVHEPILALVTAYMSYLYGILYLMFEAVSVPCHCLWLRRTLTGRTVSHLLPRRPRLVSRRRCPPFLLVPDRCRHGWRDDGLLDCYKLQAGVHQAWRSNTGRAATAYDRWRYHLAYRTLLARMDEYAVGDSGAAGNRFGVLGHVLSCYVLAGCELYHCESAAN